MSGFGFGYGFHRTGGFKFDGSAQAYFDAVPDAFSDARKVIINTLISTLKFDNNWNKLDRLWLFANTTTGNAVIDIKGLASVTLVNSPTFTADQGYAGNSSTMYIDTKWDASTNGVNYTRNSASAFIYSRTNLGVGADAAFGGIDGSNNGIQLFPRNASDILSSHINQATTDTESMTNSTGLFDMIRTASNAYTTGRNGSQTASHTTASTAVTTNDIYVLARNNNGTAASYSGRQYSVFALGSGAIARGTFYTAIQTYMTSLGTQV